jgi:4-hydroxy-3-polyprenylbenzoate decarboxylase
MAFGASTLDEVGRRLGDVLEMQPPEGSWQRCAAAEAEVDRGLAAEDRARRPAQEVVLTGDDVDLDLLPIQRCWPGDPAPFITLPAVITHDPRDGHAQRRHVPMQKVDRRTTLMHWQIHKDGRADYLFATGRLEVAVALGLDPISAYSASARCRSTSTSSCSRASSRARRSSSCAGRRSPSTCRERGDRARGLRRAGRPRAEGPFGDHTGYYTGVEPFRSST